MDWPGEEPVCEWFGGNRLSIRAIFLWKSVSNCTAGVGNCYSFSKFENLPWIKTAYTENNEEPTFPSAFLGGGYLRLWVRTGELKRSKLCCKSIPNHLWQITSGSSLECYNMVEKPYLNPLSVYLQCFVWQVIFAYIHTYIHNLYLNTMIFKAIKLVGLYFS